jgi:hypothetical protein
LVLKVRERGLVVDTPRKVAYYHHGGVLPYVLHHLSQGKPALQGFERNG